MPEDANSRRGIRNKPPVANKCSKCSISTYYEICLGCDLEIEFELDYIINKQPCIVYGENQ